MPRARGKGSRRRKASKKAPPPHAGVVEMAAAVRRRRAGLGLTQVQLGRFAGCGPVFVYDLEAGKPTLRLSKILDVLAVLGLELRLADGKRGLAVDDALRGPGDSTP